MSIRNETLEDILTATQSNGVQLPLVKSTYNSDNALEVHSASDLDDMATGGVITVNAKLAIVLMVPLVITSVKFIVNDGAELTISSYGNAAFVLVYTLSDDWVTLNNGTFRTFLVKLSSTSGATLVNSNSTNSTIPAVSMISTLVNSFHLGEINSTGVVIIHSFFIDWLSGFKITDTFLVTFAHATFGRLTTPAVSDSAITLKSKYPGTFSMTGTNGRFESTESFLRVDPGIESENIIVNNSPFRGAMFDTSAGSSGSFVSISDDSISLTSLLVEDSAGIARFTFTGPTLFINQSVNITGFVTNGGYNGVLTIESTDGTSYFEGRIESTVVLFGSIESGDFTSDRVTISEVGTAIVDGDSFTLKNDGVINYYGGYTAYNSLVNSFQINAGFLGTAVGVWDKTPINGKDVRLTVISSTSEQPSKSLGSVIVNANTQTTDTSTTSQWVKFNLDGLATPCSNIERWSVVNNDTGALRIDDKIDFVGGAIISLSVSSSGGGQLFEFRLVKNDLPLPDNVVIQRTLTSSAGNIMLQVPVNGTKGDIFDCEVRNVEGTSLMTVISMSSAIK